MRDEKGNLRGYGYINLEDEESFKKVQEQGIKLANDTVIQFENFKPFNERDHPKNNLYIKNFLYPDELSKLNE